MAKFDLGGKSERVVRGIINVVVVLSILAAILPIAFVAVGDINFVFTNNATLLNNSVAAAIAPIFPILIALSFLLGVVTFVLSSTDLGRKLRGR